MVEAVKTPATTETKKNCAGCNKPMKKKVKYYRNGSYYCNKKCFKKAQATKAEGSAAEEKTTEKKE